MYVSWPEKQDLSESMACKISPPPKNGILKVVGQVTKVEESGSLLN